MMKIRILPFVTLVLAVCSLYSCNGCGKSKDGEGPGGVTIITSIPDVVEAVGTAGDGTSMNELEFITENGDTVSITTPGEMVMGGVDCGDKLSVVYYTNKEGENLASVAINLTALQHLWTQKGADGSEQSIEINPGGRLITYNMKNEYNAWTIKDGDLLLHLAKKTIDEKAETVDTFQILQLDDERLVLMSHDIETEFELAN